MITPLASLSSTGAHTPVFPLFPPLRTPDAARRKRPSRRRRRRDPHSRPLSTLLLPLASACFTEANPPLFGAVPSPSSPAQPSPTFRAAAAVVVTDSGHHCRRDLPQTNRGELLNLSSPLPEPSSPSFGRRNRRRRGRDLSVSSTSFRGP